MPVLEVAVAKRLGDFSLDVAFSAETGLVALFGRSGAGKSMTIGLIAGLVRPDRGRIVLDGRTLVDAERRIFVPPWRRRIGLVFQDSHLLPHLSVGQNLGFGRWFARRRTTQMSVDAVVATLGIGHLMARRPAVLSGGERQRVAIGRALLSGPDLLLFDEPFAALDAARKRDILPLVERVRDEFRVPIVFVSHALEEVARLAARVVLIDGGRVTAIGEPDQVFGPSRTAGGDSRFDRASVLSMVLGTRDAAYGLTELRHPAGIVRVAGPAPGRAGTHVQIVVRATDVVVSVAAVHVGLSLQNILAGHVAAIEPDGALATVEIALLGGGRLFAAVTRRSVEDLALAVGRPVHALIKTVALDERAFS